MAFLFFPICKNVESLLLKTKRPFVVKRVRGLATGMVMLVTFILLISLFFKIVPILYVALIKFVREVSFTLEDSYSLLEEKVKNIEFLSDMLKEIENHFSYDKITQIFVSLDYKGYFGSLYNVILKIFNVFIGVIISIYILLERYNIKKAVMRVFNVTLERDRTRQLVRIWRKTKKIIYTFIFGQIVDAFIVACMLGSAFSIFRMENSVIFAAIYFVFAIIPYFGSILAVALISLFSFVLGDFNKFLTTIIISIVLQQIDSNFINPKIVGQAVGIKPLYVILGITLFGGVFGVVGLFLGPPLMAVCMELLDDIIKARELKKAKQNKSLNKNIVLKYFKDLN